MGVAKATAAVAAIRDAAGAPLAVSISAQTGQAALACYAAALAGAYRVDVALSPLGGGASMPSAEALLAGFAGTEVDPGMDLTNIADAALVLEEVLVHYADVMDPLAVRLDTSALRGLLPPSAMGHALAELRHRDSLNRLSEVEHEVARVRAELGNPPLVTPMTEIIATQAVYNVVEGDRYATISQEVKDFCLGLYGDPPEPVDPDVRRLVNGREEPITCRPADLLEPAKPAARRELKREGIDRPDDAALVTYVLFPHEYLALARGDAIAEGLGDEPGDTAAEPESPLATDAPGDGAAVEASHDVGQPAVRELTVEVDGQQYSVRVIGDSGASSQTATATATGGPVPVREGTVVAPMQGMILKVAVKVGDRVNLGDVVAVLEAMKMQNDITATRSGSVAEVFVEEGVVVSPRDPIVHISE
jgi:pyruvate carboxylase subunit B